MKATQPRKPGIWFRLLGLLLLLIFLALVHAILDRFFPHLIADVIVLIILVVCSAILSLSNKQRTGELDRNVLKRREHTREAQEHGDVEGVAHLDVRELDCPSCHKPVRTSDNELEANINDLKGGGFAIKCRTCGAFLNLGIVEKNKVVVAGTVSEKSRRITRGISLFFGLICATGTVMAALICYDPKQSDPAMRILFRIAGGCIALAALPFSVFCLFSFFAYRPRKTSDTDSP